MLLHLLKWCIALLCLTNAQKYATPIGHNASSQKHALLFCFCSYYRFQQCPCVNPGSSDVTATSTTAATPSRRLLQTSTENIGLNITLPAGTNISQAIATLTAASGNGTGTLLTAAQQAYVLLSSPCTRQPGPAVIPMHTAWACYHPHTHSLGLLSSPSTQPGPAVIPMHTAWACCCCALMPRLSHVASCHFPGRHWAHPDCPMYFAHTGSQPSHMSSKCCPSSVKWLTTLWLSHPQLPWCLYAGLFAM